MLKNLSRTLLLTCALALTNITPSQAQDYLEFESDYYDCGLAMNYHGEVASMPCRLVFTYDGYNLNLHFMSEAGNINFVTSQLNSGAVSVSNRQLYLARGIYYISFIRLTTTRGETVSIDGNGQCEKTVSDITCIFNDTDGNRFVGVAE